MAISILEKKKLKSSQSDIDTILLMLWTFLNHMIFIVSLNLMN